MSKVRDSSAPKMILGACWGVRAIARHSSSSLFSRLLVDEIYHLIELPFEWLIDDAMFVCLLDELKLGFC